MAAAAKSLGEVIERDGYTLLRNVYTAEEVKAIAADLYSALAQPCAATAIRSQEGVVYAARNILELWPAVDAVWRRPVLLDALTEVLGPRLGLVRGLYFDKPPDRTWALPWHKDLTVAVREHLLPSTFFSKPTTKAGVAHLEAPQQLLENMLTVRVHLDAMTALNGPMRVLPGSHLTGKTLTVDEARGVDIISAAGDVLLIRPLVTHSSGVADPANTSHRRVLHLEFAARPDLPDAHTWHTFLPANEVPRSTTG